MKYECNKRPCTFDKTYVYQLSKLIKGLTDYLYDFVKGGKKEGK